MDVNILHVVLITGPKVVTVVSLVVATILVALVPIPKWYQNDHECCYIGDCYRRSSNSGDLVWPCSSRHEMTSVTIGQCLYHKLNSPCGTWNEKRMYKCVLKAAFYHGPFFPLSNQQNVHQSSGWHRPPSQPLIQTISC
jgi:hypothetical protein